jgi:dipeptidase D
MCNPYYPAGKVWDMFKVFLSTPHPSGKEQRLAAKLKAMADDAGLPARFDAYGNLRIDRPATAGFEHLPAVIMQGHLDMVCEKVDGLDFNFDTDPIKTRTEGDYLFACGTTLGGDNGIGCAMSLALLFDPEYRGRAVAGVFTLQEETGLFGANNLDKDMLTGKYLLNLDSGEEGSFYIGCAGGARLTVELNTPLCQAPEGNCVEISVSGLPGGHSGGTIHLKHGNALIFLARILEATDADVCSISGGTADNVIPSNASAVVICNSSPESLANELVEMAEKYKKTLGNGFDVEVTVKETVSREYVWQSDLRRKLVHTMANVPNEVLSFSDEFNVPETSSNFASVSSSGNILKLKFSQRSLVNAKRKEATRKVISAFDGLDCRFTLSGEYSGWTPVKESHLKQTSEKVWKELFNETAEIKVVHAGLEAGILSEKKPELEIISFGPTSHQIHSSNESVQISSVNKVFEFLKALIKAL